MLSSHTRLGLPNGLYSWPPNQNPANTSSLPMRATCPAYLIILDLVSLIILGEMSLEFVVWLELIEINEERVLQWKTSKVNKQEEIYSKLVILTEYVANNGDCSICLIRSFCVAYTAHWLLECSIPYIFVVK
jgi:hypothetical protein